MSSATCPSTSRIARLAHASASARSCVTTKLDLRDRVQAVVLAYETGLIAPGTEA